MESYVLGTDRLPKTGPSGFGMILSFGTEKGELTPCAEIDSGLIKVVVFTREGWLGRTFPKDLVLKGSEPLFPLRVRQNDFFSVEAGARVCYQRNKNA